MGWLRETKQELKPIEHRVEEHECEHRVDAHGQCYCANDKKRCLDRVSYRRMFYCGAVYREEK